MFCLIPTAADCAGHAVHASGNGGALLVSLLEQWLIKRQTAISPAASAYVAASRLDCLSLSQQLFKQ